MSGDVISVIICDVHHDSKYILAATSILLLHPVCKGKPRKKKLSIQIINPPCIS